MKERRYYSASRLTTILSVLVAAIGISVSLLTEVTTRTKVGIVFVVAVSIVAILLVARLSRESLYRSLEQRVLKVPDEAELTRDALEQMIRSQEKLTSKEVSGLRNVNPRELELFTNELADNLRSRHKPKE